MSTDSSGSVLSWAAAGVPLLAAFVQTLLALFGYTSNSAGLTPIIGPVLSVPVLYEAAVIFKSSSVIVMSLFLLITAAWTTQGATTFLLETREASYGAATLSSVLFFALFFGVYAPLLSAGISAIQLGAFFLVPVAAALCQFYSVWAYPWNDVVLTETSGNLGRLESQLSDLRTSFETQYENRFGDVGPLSKVAPTGVEAVRRGAEDFRDQLDEVAEDLETGRQLSVGEQARARQRELEGTLDELSVEQRLDELDRQFLQRLTSGIRTEYGEFDIQSRYGEPFELVNLPTQHREISLAGVSRPVHIDQLDDALIEMVREAESYTPVAKAVQTVGQHRDEMTEYVARREDRAATNIETATTQLKSAQRLVDTSTAPFSGRMENVLIDGRDSELKSRRSIEQKITNAREALHECRFDRAEQISERAAEDASDLVSVAEFLSTVTASIENRHESVSVPSNTADGYVQALRPSIQGSYDNITVSYDGGLLRFEYPQDTSLQSTDGSMDDGERTTAGESNVDVSSPSSAHQRSRVSSPEDVVDEVLFAFREFSESVDDSDVVVQYNLDELPDAVARQSVLVNVERFAGRQSDLFEDVDLQNPEPPGFIEFKPVSGTSSVRALDEVHRRFRERYA